MTTSTHLPRNQPDDLLSFMCWNCERGISVPKEKAGRRGRCPSCRAPQRVPGGHQPERKKRAREEKITPTRAVVARARRPRPRRSSRRSKQSSPIPYLLAGMGFLGIFGLIMLGLSV